MQKKFKDQLGREVLINYPPKRIVSLVPSLSELLFDLGLQNEIIGITKFCLHPKSKCDGVQKIGGTKDINISLMESLQPDLIIASKEENVKEQIENLEKFPVWVSDIKCLDDALGAIQVIGEMVGKASEASALTFHIQKTFKNFTPKFHSSVAYMIWRKPYMTIGNDTFIHDMLSRWGMRNVFGSQSRYPVITADELKQASPDFIFLSSEPYPFKEKHLEEFQNICPDAKILLVDGEYFSWYGSRLQGTVSYFNSLNDQVKLGL